MEGERGGGEREKGEERQDVMLIRVLYHRGMPSPHKDLGNIIVERGGGELRGEGRERKEGC